RPPPGLDFGQLALRGRREPARRALGDAREPRPDVDVTRDTLHGEHTRDETGKVAPQRVGVTEPHASIPPDPTQTRRLRRLRSPRRRSRSSRLDGARAGHTV